MTQAAPLAQALRDAARMVANVAAGRSLADEFERHGAGPARAALIDLTHGTLRRYGRNQALVRELARRGAPDAELAALLWCAFYALESGRYAEYTVVDQAVRASGLLERWSAKGFVNAMLRSFLRERRSLEARIAADAEARLQHPRWWVDLVRAAYPERAEGVLAAGNSHPPMTLRVNFRRTNVKQYQEKLAGAGILSKPMFESALLLEQPVGVDRLPGFAAGDVSVQDAAAQRAARCLDLAPGQQVLDACAAPGGKAAHILESADVSHTALDVEARRLERVRGNLSRLGLHAQVREGDACHYGQWWDGKPFDRILADVPCTSAGVARRHPDLKWLRRADDVPAFAARQSRLLDALWRTLGRDGKLLYVTCSVFSGENEAVVNQFIARTPGAQRLPLPDGGPAQWLPGPEHDGFYYALLKKQA
jgi:16S rRNA (cytosine967-C5)-methyltransferase